MTFREESSFPADLWESSFLPMWNPARDREMPVGEPALVEALDDIHECRELPVCLARPYAR